MTLWRSALDSFIAALEDDDQDTGEARRLAAEQLKEPLRHSNLARKAQRLVDYLELAT